jgi:membrane protease YdiL (CAAX protease family)
MEQQHSSEGPRGLTTRLYLPAWIRPPAKSERNTSTLQYLPLYVVVAVLLYLVLRTGIEYLLPAATPRLWGELLAKAILAIAMIAPALAISRIEGRSFGDFGLPARQAFGGLFWIGVLWGLISLSLLLLILHAADTFSYGSVVLHGPRVWKLALFWGAFFFCVALFEEFTFRGYTQFAIQQVAGFWPAALLLSAIFAYIHHSNPGETWLGTLGAGTVALFFCFTLQRTGNLWFAVGMHASWDWAQSFFYGVPDSGVVEPGHLLQASLHGPTWLTGGTVGPEGSVLLFVLIAGMWVVFDRVVPAKTISPRRHGDTEKRLTSLRN